MSNKKLLIEACDTQELTGIFDNVEIQVWGCGCGHGCKDAVGVACGSMCH
ncbi:MULTISPECIES: hypothetical protein [unclassified Treponema]|nr:MULTISPECIES: hypothetical protein [unclassified Treponema]UTC66947.1 hypothetical protein E4O06_13545 [Treponema sp. OMZ 789]UTC69676.1 hypothetical protein E4O01_13685 [Treponema sp. OMZ 790]UTC72390.1 hypothetical protein E4O02_13775 [Treponema sp. OMZ 791]